MNKLTLFLLFILAALSASAQAIRIDPLPTTTVAGNNPSGAMTPLLAIPGAAISINGTTYTDSSAAIACPSNSPVVLAGTSSCVRTSDAQGNFGFWLLPGSYNYTITIQNKIYGPYPITAGASIGSVTYLAPWTNAVARSAQSVFQDRRSVKDFGAKGDGVSDDTVFINNALAFTQANSSALYFPCGTYITTDIIAAYGTKPVRLYGEGRDCTVIKYTGSKSITAVLDTGSDAGGTYFVYGNAIQNMTIQGNANTTYALRTLRSVQTSWKDLALGPASNACWYQLSNVANVADNIVCDPNHFGGWPGGVTPQNGFVIDGTGFGDQSTTTHFITPTIQGVSGIGFWCKNCTHETVTSGQISNVASGLEIDVNASSNTFISTLFEGPTAADNIIIYGSFNNFENCVFTSGKAIHLFSPAQRNTFKDSNMNATIKIDSGVTGTIFKGNFGPSTLAPSSAGITDNAGDTLYDNFYDYTASNLASNFPQIQRTAPMNMFGGGDKTIELRGTWYSSSPTDNAVLSPYVFTTGKAWKAILIGSTLASGSPVTNGGASIVEISDTSSHVNVSLGRDLVFFVDSDGKLKMNLSTTIAPGSRLGWTGTIYFMPASGLPGGAGSGNSAAWSGAVTVGTTLGTGGKITGGGDIQAASQLKSLIATGTAPLSVASSTPVANLTANVTMYAPNGTLLNSPANNHFVVGTGTLDGTGAATVTLSGSAAYANAASYVCFAQDSTAAAPMKVAMVNGSSFNVNGTASDSFRFQCIGQ